MRVWIWISAFWIHRKTDPHAHGKIHRFMYIVYVWMRVRPCHTIRKPFERMSFPRRLIEKKSNNQLLRLGKKIDIFPRGRAAFDDKEETKRRTHSFAWTPSIYKCACAAKRTTGVEINITLLCWRDARVRAHLKKHTFFANRTNAKYPMYDIWAERKNVFELVRTHKHTFQKYEEKEFENGWSWSTRHVYIYYSARCIFCCCWT